MYLLEEGRCLTQQKRVSRTAGSSVHVAMLGSTITCKQSVHRNCLPPRSSPSLLLSCPDVPCLLHRLALLFLPLHFLSQQCQCFKCLSYSSPELARHPAPGISTP